MAHTSVRFLLLEYPAEHLATVLALQKLVGVDIIKVAGVVDAADGPPESFSRRNGQAMQPLVQGLDSLAACKDLTFAKANLLLTSAATKAEMATFVSTIGKILLDISQFYVPRTGAATAADIPRLQEGQHHQYLSLALALPEPHPGAVLHAPHRPAHRRRRPSRASPAHHSRPCRIRPRPALPGTVDQIPLLNTGRGRSHKRGARTKVESVPRRPWAGRRRRQRVRPRGAPVDGALHPAAGHAQRQQSEGAEIAGARVARISLTLSYVILARSIVPVEAAPGRVLGYRLPAWSFLAIHGLPGRILLVLDKRKLGENLHGYMYVK